MQLGTLARRRAPLVIALIAALVIAACGNSTIDADLARAQEPVSSLPTTTTTAAPSTTVASTVPTTVATTTTTEPPTTTTTEPPTRWSAEVYEGSGAWVDVYDWTLAYTNGNPPVTVASIDRMAELGVETLYIQTSRTTSVPDVEEPERLNALIDRAHARRLAVVAWYLPTLVDLDVDERRLLAAAALDVDGLSVNLESKAVEDVADRNRRMVELSRRVDTALAGEPLATVILNPFALDELVPDAWPDFPWTELDPYYEIWQPMVYVSYRPDGDPYDDPYRYTKTSMAHMRAMFPNEPIHPVTGIADEMTVEGVEDFVRAAREEGAIGGGIYDWATSTEAMWPPLTTIAG